MTAVKYHNGSAWEILPRGPQGPAATTTFTLEFTIGDGASVITTGEKKTARVQCPRSGVITGWRILSLDDTSGSITIDLWKSASYSLSVSNTITASAKPSISSATSGSSTTLTGWTTTITAGDYVSLNVDSVTSLKAVKLILYYVTS